jgi:hypothetical protein
MAGVTGLEPATSCVTGKRSNQLSYTPQRGRKIMVEIIANFVLKKFLMVLFK